MKNKNKYNLNDLFITWKNDDHLNLKYKDKDGFNIFFTTGDNGKMLNDLFDWLEKDSSDDFDEKVAEEVFEAFKELVVEDTYMDRMSEELDDLYERLDKLEKFMKTDEFKKLDELDRGLLKLQYQHMDNYYEVLEIRLGLARAKEILGDKDEKQR